MEETLTYEKILDLFKKSDERFDKRLQREAEKREREVEKREEEREKERKLWNEKYEKLHIEIGGIGRSNGDFAEEFFYTALANKMEVAGMSFDYIDQNLKRKRNYVQAEYDIVLYNDYKILVVEVKYKFRKQHLLKFHNNLKNFKSLSLQYKGYKIYGAIAGLTFEEDVFEEAETFGFYILTQNNDNIAVINSKDFEPNLIK